MGVQFAPEWEEYPENVRGIETDTITFNILAVDLNGDMLELTMNRNGLPEAAQFTDNGDGSGRFEWVTNFDDEGRYRPIFTASDGELDDEISVQLTVTNLNRAPKPFNLAEPQDLTILGDYQTQFIWDYSIDEDGDRLEYWLHFEYSLCDSNVVKEFWPIGDSARYVYQLDTLLRNNSIPNSLVVTWWVEAADMDSFTVSNQRWSFVLPQIQSAQTGDGQLPKEFALEPVYPNPFNALTRVIYDLPTAGIATVTIHDIAGRTVAKLTDGHQDGGRYETVWDGGGYAAGMYFIRLSAGGKVMVRKAILIR